MRRLASALLTLTLVTACAGADPAERFVGRYAMPTAAGGIRGIEFHADGRATWTESSPTGGVVRNDGKFSVMGDSAYMTFAASRPEGSDFGMIAATRGDTLDVVLVVDSVRIPIVMVRTP